MPLCLTSPVPRRWSPLLASSVLGAALALALAPACAPAPPAVAPAPPPSASTAAPQASTAPPAGGNWAPVDPRAVRCGIDDRPRSVIGSIEIPPDDRPRLALRAIDPNAGAVARRPFKPMPMPTPIPITPAPPPDGPIVDGDMAPEPPQLPRLFIERLAPTLGGGPLPPELSSAFLSTNPQYEICANLASDSMPAGRFDLELELASTGAPLRVLPTAEGQPSAFARCLMERTCQYQARASLGQLTRVRVPIQVSRDQPPPPPPARPPPSQPLARVDAATESPRPDGAELELQIRSTATEAARRCGAVGGRARVRFTVELTGPSPGGGPRRGRMAPVARVSQVRTQALEGSVDTGIIGCVVSSLTSRTFPLTSAAPRAERVILTWNP